MSITNASFEIEQELADWVSANITRFIPDCTYLPGFQVTTSSGKRGVPDGFAFSFLDRRWYIVEYELIRHGVWDHITEQVVRFKVATENPQTMRDIRDALHDYVLEDETRITEVCSVLNTNRDHLLQQLEAFIEGNSPQVVIFIDEKNQDLEDMAEAIGGIDVYRVQKFIAEGKNHYYSGEEHTPVISTDLPQRNEGTASEFDALEALGGGRLLMNIRGWKAYSLTSGGIINVRRSRYYPRHDYYWYGISPSALEYCQEHDVDHVVFIMGTEGLVKVPLNTVEQFLEGTKTTDYSDGTVRHYHCLISASPKPELYYSEEVTRFSLKEYFVPM